MKKGGGVDLGEKKLSKIRTIVVFFFFFLLDNVLKVGEDRWRRDNPTLVRRPLLSKTVRLNAV